MRWRTSIVLVISLGLMAAFILYRTRPPRRGSTFAPSSQPNVISKVTQEELPFPLRNHPALAPLTVKNVTTDAGRNAATSLAMVKPDLESLSSKWLAVGDVEPGAKAFFEDGFRLERGGSYREARLAFQTLINTYPDCGLAAPAYWAVGLAYYQEGGSENLLHATDQFKNFVGFFGNREQELAEAAQLDIAVINMQLMGSTILNSDRRIYAGKVANALKTFLARWPRSPYAPAARLQLEEIQNLHIEP